MAAETFYHNLIDRIDNIDQWHEYCNSSLLHQFRSKLIVGELNVALNEESVIENIRSKDIDLVAGGPPCQGFSIAGRRDPLDIRNQLVWEFLEFVEKVCPKAVIIENVIGLRQDFTKHNCTSPFSSLQIALEQTGAGYTVQPVLLNAMYFGVPQNRPRLMLLALRNDIAKSLGIVNYTELWQSDYDFAQVKPLPERPDLAPVVGKFGDNPRAVRDALWDIGDLGYCCDTSDPRYRERKGEYAREMRGIELFNENSELPNHKLRKHGEKTKNRFQLYHYFEQNGIKSNILNIPSDSRLEKEQLCERLNDMLYRAELPAIAPDGTLLATTKDELIQVIINLRTKKHSQRPVKWAMPSPTVLSLPDDLIHPLSPRTFTVREMARLQSFPDSFKFRSKETTGSLKRRMEVPQYTQVGNAVPPLLAQAVGEVFSSLLKLSIGETTSTIQLSSTPKPDII